MIGITGLSLIVALVVGAIAGLIIGRRHGRLSAGGVVPQNLVSLLLPEDRAAELRRRPLLLTGKFKASNFSDTLAAEQILLQVRKALYPLYNDAETVAEIAQRAAEELKTRRLQMLGHQGTELTRAQR